MKLPQTHPTKLEVAVDVEEVEQVNNQTEEQPLMEEEDHLRIHKQEEKSRAIRPQMALLLRLLRLPLPL